MSTVHKRTPSLRGDSSHLRTLQNQPSGVPIEFDRYFLVESPNASDAVANAGRPARLFMYHNEQDCIRSAQTVAAARVFARTRLARCEPEHFGYNSLS